MLGDHVWLTVVGVQSVPTLPGRVEPRPLCRPVRFFHTELGNPFLYRAGLHKLFVCSVC